MLEVVKCKIGWRMKRCETGWRRREEKLLEDDGALVFKRCIAFLLSHATLMRQWV